MRAGSLFIFLLMLATCPRLAQAQSIRIDVEDASLKEVLEQVRTQAAIDVVFAERLVEARVASCQYTGNNPGEALTCILNGTGVQAERVRRRQYVLIEVPMIASLEATPPPSERGMLLGFILDSETDDPLPGAHIYLPALRMGTVTNEAGYFALPSLPVGAYDVHVSYLGFAEQDLVLEAGATPAIIHLNATTLEAGEVVVESEHAEMPGREAEPGVVSMPVQRLEKLPGLPGEPDLFQALQWLPGVQKSGEINGGLIVRGGQPDENLYLLDGAPVYYPWHAFSLISTFQTETFKDIKLYRGAFPAEHGGRLSAVLDAEMRDGSRVRPRALAALSVISGRFIVESPLSDKASFMLSGRRSYLDQIIGRKHPVEEDGRRDTLRTGYFFNDVSAKVTARPGLRHRLSVSYYGGGDALDLRLPFDLSLNLNADTNPFSDWLKPADLFFEIDHSWGNRLISTRHQYLYSRRLFITTTAYRSSYRARESVLMRPTDASSVSSDYSVRLRDYGLKTDVDFYPSLTHQVRLGAQVVRRVFKSRLDATVKRSLGTRDDLNDDSRQEAMEIVGYVQDVWQPTPNWVVQPGIRLSAFSSGRYMRLSPRLSARYAVDPRKLVLRGSGGMQWQYLHRIRDRFSFLYDLVSSRWITTTEDVRPSSSVQISFGAESNPALWLTLAADGYWRGTEGILLPRDTFQTKGGLEGPGIEVGTLLGQYTVGKARAYGIELSARAEQEHWQLWLNYAGGRSLSRAPKLGEGGYRPARYDVPRSFRSILSHTKKRWAFSWSVEWRSGYPYTVPEARYALADPLDEEPTLYLFRPQINNGRLPPYLRFDLNVAYRIRLGGTAFSSRMYLYNITNRRNIIDREFDPRNEDRVEVRDRRGLFILPLLEFQLEI